MRQRRERASHIPRIAHFSDDFDGFARFVQAEFLGEIVQFRDAYLGRLTLARGQMEKAASTLPPAIRPVGNNLLAGHLYVSARRGFKSRNEETAAEQARDMAGRAYRRAISEGEGKTGSARLVAQAYRGLGMLHADDGRHCEAKAALTKYLELATAAADASAIRRRVLELPC